MLEVLLVGLFVLISILDVMTTTMAMDRGLYEYNLILKYIYKRFKTKGHIMFKLVTLLLYVFAATYIPLSALIIINIVFTLIVINNVWELMISCPKTCDLMVCPRGEKCKNANRN